MKLRMLWSLAAITILAIGCRKDPMNNLSEEESRIYITNSDSTVNFSNYQTFSISDSVVVIDGNDVSVQNNETNHAFISAVKSEMQQLGYTLVSRSEKPDLGVTVSRIVNTSTGVISYDNYWDYYSGFYDPFYWGYGGYGWGAPSFGYATYQVREGLLSVDIADLKNAEANNMIKVVWNGMIRGSGIFNQATASSQVSQLFDQSPYLSNK